MSFRRIRNRSCEGPVSILILLVLAQTAYGGADAGPQASQVFDGWPQGSYVILHPVYAVGSVGSWPELTAKSLIFGLRGLAHAPRITGEETRHEELAALIVSGFIAGLQDRGYSVSLHEGRIKVLAPDVSEQTRPIIPERASRPVVGEPLPISAVNAAEIEWHRLGTEFSLHYS